MRSQLTIDLASKTNGLPVAGATVTVKKVDGTNATLYAGSTGGTTVTNPITSDANGFGQAWLDRGKYRLVYGGGITRADEWIDASPGDDGAVDAVWGSALSPGSSGLLSARPAAASVPVGYRYHATDDWGGTTYMSTGAAWIAVDSKNQQVLDLAAAASGTFSGLDGNTDLGYLLDYVLDTSVSSQIGWQANGDTAAANYATNNAYSQNAAAWVVNQTTGVANAALTINTTGANRVAGAARLMAKTGATRDCHAAASISGGNRLMWQGVGWWTNTAANLTSLTIVGTAGTLTGRVVLRRLRIPT